MLFRTQSLITYLIWAGQLKASSRDKNSKHESMNEILDVTNLGKNEQLKSNLMNEINTVESDKNKNGVPETISNSYSNCRKQEQSVDDHQPASGLKDTKSAPEKECLSKYQDRLYEIRDKYLSKKDDSSSEGSGEVMFYISGRNAEEPVRDNKSSKKDQENCQDIDQADYFNQYVVVPAIESTLAYIEASDSKDSPNSDKKAKSSSDMQENVDLKEIKTSSPEQKKTPKSNHANSKGINNRRNMDKLDTFKYSECEQYYKYLINRENFDKNSKDSSGVTKPIALCIDSKVSHSNSSTNRNLFEKSNENTEIEIDDIESKYKKSEGIDISSEKNPNCTCSPKGNDELKHKSTLRRNIISNQSFESEDLPKYNAPDATEEKEPGFMYYISKMFLCNLFQ